MRRSSRLILVLLSTTATACTITANLNTGYRPRSAIGRLGDQHPSIAVRRFTDARPPRVYTTLGRGFLTYVPLISYVAMPYERLDESARKAGEEVYAVMPPFDEYTYPASISRAIAADLAASDLFERVDYIGDGPIGGQRYVLSGSLRASPLEKDLTSYGLGVAGVLLWMLPIPAGQVWASVTLDLTLEDATTGKQVWQKTLSAEYAKWVSLYTSSPSLVYGGATSFDITQLPSTAQVDRESLFSWHFEVLRRAMEPVPKEMAAALEQP